MSNDSSEQPRLSPEDRKRLQELFENGNRQMTQGSYDYASEMFFTPCVLGDPGNLIYLQSYVANLRKKFGDRKKKGMLSFLSGASLKTAEARKQWRAVQKAALDLLKSNPWNSSAFFSMGKALLEMDYSDTGLACLKHAIDCDPKDIEANRFAARLLRELKKYDDAIACWNRVMTKFPNDDEARRAMSAILVEKTIHKGAYDSEDGVKGVHAASISKKPADDQHEDVMGRPLTFEEVVERKLKKNPDDIDLYLELADHFFQAGKYRKAEETYKRALKVGDNTPAIEERLLETQKKQLLDDAMRIKAEFEKTKKPELKDKFYTAKELLEKKSLEVAIHRVKHYPTNSTFHFELGTLYMQMGKFKEAIGEFQTAKMDVSRAGDCLISLGQCFQHIKQYKLAMDHYRQAIGAISESSESKKKALYLAARLAFGLKDYKEAEEFASQLAAIDFSYKDIGELLDKVTQKRDN